jgi:cytochrome d ubiquinol oxidase subunit I
MAMEGHYDTRCAADPYIWDPETRKNGGSITPSKSQPVQPHPHDLYAPFDGLDTIPDEDEPPVAIFLF